MANNKFWLGLILVSIFASSGIIYLTFQDQVRIRVDKDQTTFYVPHEEYNWIWTVAGREQNRLFDGTSIMNRDKKGITVETEINEETQEMWITRTTPYQRGPIIIDEYYFKGDIDGVEKFPISHKITILNGKGYYFRYTNDDLTDTGEKRKLKGETSLSFGRNMKVEFEPDYRWAWVGWPYGAESFSAQYDINSDEKVFNMRLFDPVYCNCSGLDNNWEIDMSNNCNLNENCDIGNGNLTFIGEGTMICNATMDVLNIGDLDDGQTILIAQNCKINVG